MKLDLPYPYSSFVNEAIEKAFKAGYHCQWIRDFDEEGAFHGYYIFDPNMKPGDPDGAFAAWLASEDADEIV